MLPKDSRLKSMSNCIVNNNYDLRQRTALAVKKHIEQRGHEPELILTPKLAMRWWNQLNVAVFNGILNRPLRIDTLCWVGKEGTLGECESWGDEDDDDPDGRFVVIRLKKKMKTRKVFFSVLIHEMVHQWEWETLGKVTHHKYFYMWKDTIRESVGLPLAEYVDDFIDD